MSWCNEERMKMTVSLSITAFLIYTTFSHLQIPGSNHLHYHRFLLSTTKTNLKYYYFLFSLSFFIRPMYVPYIYTYYMLNTQLWKTFNRKIKHERKKLIINLTTEISSLSKLRILKNIAYIFNGYQYDC